jgi:hypothetical protein
LKTARANATSPSRVSAFKALRVAFLLLILLTVALTSWREHYRSTRWQTPLFVAIYPIAGDASAATKAYVEGLTAQSFKPIDRFFSREAARYGLATTEPMRTRLRPVLAEIPPQHASDAGFLATVWWSLRLRYWAWRVSNHTGEPDDIRVFVIYHDPNLSPTVPHSLGLSKGLIGVVYAFAAAWMGEPNDVVIAHEMLHTVGATDKYDAHSDAPLFPDGYGDPQQTPLYPQRRAELMAGRRMLSRDRWEQADDLDEVVIGSASALEIRWRSLSRAP